jgi:P27 family predicted phage terminase small subunit
MGKRGPQPKPTARKKLEGNPGKRKLNKREPRPNISAKIKPREIDQRAREFISVYVPQLQAMQILTDADQAGLELMAVHYSIAWQAAEIVKREGILVKGPFGKVKNPAAQVLRDNSLAFLRYADHFGMTPSSRSSLQVPLPEQPDQLEMELFGPAAQVAKSE